MKIGIFAYSFPHYKTYRGIYELLLKNWEISAVFSQDMIKLNLPSSKIRISPRNINITPVAEICKRFGIANYNVVHNDSSTSALIKKLDLDIGIILGARILKSDIINSFKIGILNLHPGIIPENRGLDNIKWAVYHNIPQGVTSHLITPQIDYGPIIEINKINLNTDDSLLDLHIKNMDMQFSMLDSSLTKIMKNKSKFIFPTNEGQYFKTMPEDIESTLVDILPIYLENQK